MRAGVAFGILLALAAPAIAFDVVHFNDGRDPVKGVILSESEKAVDFRYVIVGKHGQIAGTAEMTIPVAEIRRVERMKPAKRREMLARSEALGQRSLRIFEALRKIRVREAHLLHAPAILAETEHFHIYTTCDDVLLKELAFYLEEMYAAYQRFFKLPDGTTRPLRVYLLKDREEYERFQKKMIGIVVENPGYYDTVKGYIAVRNFAPVGKVKEVRASIEEKLREVDDRKAEVDERRRELRAAVRTARRKLEAAATRAYREVQRLRPRDVARALKEVDEWKAREVRELKHREKKWRDAFDEWEKGANDYIREGRRTILHNKRLVVELNQVLFETLFHEGFHAYVNRNLVVKGRMGRVPRWLNEGLACYFEKSIVEAGYLVHGVVNEEFRKRLRQAMTEKTLLPLRAVVSGDATDFVKIEGATGKHSDLYYAQSWVLVHYMMERVPLPRLQAYLKLASAGGGGEQAFCAMMGKSMREIEADIRIHIRTMAD